jgi:hypothetical protein
VGQWRTDFWLKIKVPSKKDCKDSNCFVKKVSVVAKVFEIEGQKRKGDKRGEGKCNEQIPFLSFIPFPCPMAGFPVKKQYLKNCY